MPDVYNESLNYLNALADKNNAWSAQQAQKQMNFQLYTSNTAHQREIADLKAAGLNPILSAGSQGAQAMSGSSAQADNSLLPAVVNILGKAVEANSAATAASLATARSRVIKDIQDQSDDSEGVALNWNKNNIRGLLNNFGIRLVEGMSGLNADDAGHRAGEKAKDFYNAIASGKDAALYDYADKYSFTPIVDAAIKIAEKYEDIADKKEEFADWDRNREKPYLAYLFESLFGKDNSYFLNKNFKNGRTAF